MRGCEGVCVCGVCVCVMECKRVRLPDQVPDWCARWQRGLREAVTAVVG